MKALALITLESSDSKNQWRFDMLMSAIAYDIEVSIVFMHKACSQISDNRMWKCLSLYDVEDVFYYRDDQSPLVNPLFNATKISKEKLHSLLHEVDLVI